MKRSKLKLAMVLALCCGTLTAAPAPWWKWRSKIDGVLICSQTPLGEGWDRAYGPFKDARCEKLIVIR
ncbi:hypothetical protein GJ698_21585 [Pseudoduganella sp. FT26W]|uniref:Secreted protein n=1 Tax=Duganella aquatilis TaxID=2666082 RepID=A0A844D3J7_9BURK|nr:hypothetical protein [Duganella aquatilis]MRW86668.1 hypothetical protein [Duganella aquatilis]